MAAAAVGSLASAAGGAVTLLAQERVIDATTSVNGAMQSAAAPNFDPFVAAVSLETPFQGPQGQEGTNRAVASINCLVDPNAIRASGNLAAEGGLAVVGGAPAPVFGEAQALVLVQFSVTEPTAYRVVASPRPSTNPEDEFEVELSRVDINEPPVIEVTEAQPPQQVDRSGVLPPGRYEVEYQVELTGEAAQVAGAFNFVMTLGQQGCPADIGTTGGVRGSDGLMNNNDFVVFIDLFFGQDPLADRGSAGGIVGGDGQFTNDDLVVFIDQFFGC